MEIRYIIEIEEGKKKWDDMKSFRRIWIVRFYVITQSDLFHSKKKLYELILFDFDVDIDITFILVRFHCVIDSPFPLFIIATTFPVFFFFLHIFSASIIALFASCLLIS